MDKAMLGKGAFATPSEMVKEVIMDFGEVSDEVFILESYAVEGIPYLDLAEWRRGYL